MGRKRLWPGLEVEKTNDISELKERFLIDECLSGDLVARAKTHGYDADYVPHIGKGGWQDWNLVPFAIENDYIVVTLNRRDFLKHHSKFAIHPGLIILIPRAPHDRRLQQADLFENALKAFATMNNDLVNTIMEVLEDGSVHIRKWNAETHDIGHIGRPVHK